MRNIRLTIEYDGVAYQGWQIQNGRRAKTIQATIQNTLKKIVREKVTLVVAGRTDSGVHACAQVANFKTNSTIPVERLKLALNGLLPSDIVIIKAEEVGLDFNSCFDAKSKIYRYTILNRSFSSALSRNQVLFYPYPLDIDLMRRACSYLIGKHDFGSFCASGSCAKHNVRTIKNIIIKLKGSSLISIDIEADGFLYNMVRNIVGTLIDVGRKKTSVAAFKSIVLSKDRRRAGKTAPAQGLCLVKVKY